MGPFNGPIFFDKEQEADFGPTSKTLARRRLVRRMTLTHLKRKTLLARNTS
jgi:hypothetical protein